MHRYKRPLSYVFRQWPYLVGILALTLVFSGVAAVQPWPLKIVLDYAVQQAPLPSALGSIAGPLHVPTTPTGLIVFAAAASLAIFAVNSVLNIALTWLWAVAGQRMVYSLSTDLFHRLQRLSLRYHARHEIGDSLSRLSGDTWCVYTLTGHLFTPIEQTIAIVTMAAISWRLNPLLAALAFATAPLLALSSVYFGKRLKKRAVENREAGTRLVSFVHQTLTAMPIVHAFGTRNRNSARFKALAGQAVATSVRGTLVGTAYGLANGLVTTTGTAIVVFCGTREVIDGALTVGSLLVFLSYMRSMQLATEALLKMYSSIKPVEASVDRVMEILDIQTNEVANRANAGSIDRGSGHIVFEGVSFAYENDRKVLMDLDFEAKPGQTIALVGATGAGKSTLVSMIPRFFDPCAGRILFDGVDLRDLKTADLRRQIAIVLQEPFLFPLTIAENIAYGRPGATRAEIIAAAKAAHADAFITRLPGGYDSIIGERGATLSGGERQRISIARALLKNAPVLILDEPTSSLDAATEASLLSALERLMEGRTTFIIAHRLYTVRAADRILLLNNGSIVESGTHQELLAQGGRYAKLHAIQYGAAVAEVA